VTEFQAFEIIFRGGPLMWPIMACSVVALAVAIERFVALRRAAVSTREFMDTIRQVLRQGRAQDAIVVCNEAEGPLARIALAGLLKHDRTRADVARALEDAGKIEAPRLERYVGALGTCASVAPLLGLLGTVQGMITCFGAIQFKQGMVNPSDLAGGIGNALVTTAAGLVVAIPAMIAHNYFVARVDHTLVQLEINGSELLELISPEEQSERF